MTLISRTNTKAAGEVKPKGDDWASRANCWAGQVSQNDGRTTRKSQHHIPLVLTGHGMNLRINNGALEVRNGFTHYPQKQETWRFFRGDQNLPTRIIVLDGSGAVTLDVFSWLSEQDIPLIQIDYRGRVVAAIGANCLGADPGLLHRQVSAAQCPKQSMTIATWLISEKLAACRGVLERVVPSSDARQVAFDHLDREIERLSHPWVGTKLALMGLEGKCAAVYFAAWRKIPINWIGLGKKPVPDRWQTIGVRAPRKNRNNKGATHPVQAMLNYGYAIFESQLRLETAKIGLDAATGFLHQQQPDRPALILDLIEPLRAKADEVLLKFVQSRTFAAADFTLSSDGTCRLHPQLARSIVDQLGANADCGKLLATLLRCIGYKPPITLPHRSKAWLAQRKIEVNS